MWLGSIAARRVTKKAWTEKHDQKTMLCWIRCIKLQPCRKVSIESSRREHILTRLDDGSFTGVGTYERLEFRVQIKSALCLQVLSRLAESRNKQALPEIKLRYGLRLPPEEDCLLGANYQLARSQAAAPAAIEGVAAGTEGYLSHPPQWTLQCFEPAHEELAKAWMK